MGNEYSRIKGRSFPASSFIVGFRQPDILQVIHAPAAVAKLVRQTVLSGWQPGIRSEKKFELGFELRLDKEPFDSEVQSIDRLVSVYKFVNQLLKALLEANCSLVTSGIFLQGAGRSSWLLRTPDDERYIATGAHGATDLLTLAFEDWGRLIAVNAPASVKSRLLDALTETWPKGVEVASSDEAAAGSFAVELREQPWDSYKSDGDRGPQIVLALVRILASEGFEFLAATHARGNMDCLTFVSSQRSSDGQCDAELLALSLNQRDQLRLYSAPEPVAAAAATCCRANWAAGLAREEETGLPGMRRLLLRASPWFGPAWDRAVVVGARELVQELLKEICSMGWAVVLNADIYRSGYDKSLLVLRRTPRAMVQPHMTVAIHEANHLLIIGASEDLKDKLVTEVRDAWSRGHHCETSELVSGWLIDFALNGNPWQWNPDAPEATVEGLGLVAALLELLTSMGWRLIANMDLTGSCKLAPTTWILQLQLDDVRRLKIG